MSWTPHILILGLFALIVTLPLAFRQPAAGISADTLRLVVITPHQEQIRYEFERAFSAWHRANFGRDVSIDWRAGNGTSDIERILLSGYRGLGAGQLDEGTGYDIVFGGGDFFFQRLKRVLDGRGILEPIDLGQEFLTEVYPAPHIADKPLYDGERCWFGVALSSFGIVFNRDALHDLGIDEVPRTWSDLGDPRLLGRVALADPAHSGSVRVTYEAIVQRYGWDRGWSAVRRACANSRYFANTSTKVATDVGAGQAAAGMCIDFYGRFQSKVVGQGRADYVAPVDATVVTADPVAVLRGTRKKELATRFVRFLLTREGQAVWCYRRGDPIGPTVFELRRPPVRRDMYGTESLNRMVDRIDLFALARPLPAGTPSYFAAIPTVLHAMAMDIHDDLRAAWEAINRQSDPKRREEMVRLFDEMPFTAEELRAATERWKTDRAAQETDRLSWTRFFREKYRNIARLGPTR